MATKFKTQRGICKIDTYEFIFRELMWLTIIVMELLHLVQIDQQNQKPLGKTT